MTRLVTFVVILSGAAACAKEPAKSAPESPPPAPVADKLAPPPTPTGAPAKEGKAKVEGQGFVVEVKPPAEATAGKEAAAQVVLTATGGYHLNKDFPNSLDLVAVDGVAFGKMTLKTADATKFEEKEAVWTVPFTASGAGDKKFQANFKFAVCTETTCDPQREALAWAVAVK
jgi:hypothetical protein